LLQGNNLPRVSSGAAHDAHEGALGAVLGVVAHFTAADVFEEGEVLQLMAVLALRAAAVADGLAVDEEFLVVDHFHGAFGTVGVFADGAVALTGHLMALAVKAHAVFVFELDEMVIVNLAVDLGLSARGAVPEHAQVSQISDLTALDAFDRLHIAGLVATLQADTHVEVILLRVLRGSENAAHAVGVRGDGLLDEHVLAEPHRFLEMLWTKAGGRKRQSR